MNNTDTSTQPTNRALAFQIWSCTVAIILSLMGTGWSISGLYDKVEVKSPMHLVRISGKDLVVDAETMKSIVCHEMGNGCKIVEVKQP